MVSRTTMPIVSDNFSETAFSKFIHDRRSKEGCSFTGMGTVKGKFLVKDEEYPQFLDLLHEYLFEQNRRPLNLVEQRRTDLQTPILIDLDFKYPFEHAIQRQFEMTNIHAFIEKYVENLVHFYNLESYDQLRFFITLRPAPYEDKKSNATSRSIKDGVHIQCPDLVLHSEHQQVLRHRALELANLGDTFKDTGYTNSDKDVFDEALVKKNGWFFYGESKPDIPAYSLVSVYVYDTLRRTFSEQAVEHYSPRNLLEILSIRYNLKVRAPAFQEGIEEEWQTRLDHCVGKRTALGTTTMDDKPPNDVMVINVISNNNYEQYGKDKIALAKRIAIECLSAERANSYQSWLEVGWCLHNIDPSEDMFNTWLEFSSKSHKASENNVNSLIRDWNRGWSRSVGERHFTSRSLHMWAKQDNPKKYKKIMEDSYVEFIDREVDATHTHVARLMKHMYGNTYCAAVDSKKVDWYEFTGIYWKKLAQGIELRNKMIFEVAEIISTAKTYIRNKLYNENTDEDFITKRMLKLHKVETGLYTSGFKDSVMKDCTGLFYEEDFQQKLNSNPFLIGFNNGVLDLHALRDKGDGTKEYFVQFRKAEPTDYVSFMAGRWLPKQCEAIDYVEYDAADPDQAQIHAEIDDFMSKVFPRVELRRYMWRKLSSCLEGANREQTYDTWIGVGGNGKSKLVDLMAMSLGDYCTSLQSTALTRKRPESGAANPDIMAIRNKRFIYMAEPDDREPLNTSRMKQFTGEDVVEARGLFEDQTKFQITGKMFMLCNAFPAINTMDRGTWRRVRASPFESKFVDPATEDVNPAMNIYPRDNDLDNKLKKWRVLFMSRLVHIYKTEYLHGGLGVIPAIVMAESNKYQESFDSVAKFINARIREIPRGGYEANIKDIFRVYKNWYEGIGGGVGRKLAQNDLYKRLCDKLGEPSDKKTFKQVRLFEDDPDIEEYDNQLKMVAESK